MGIHFGGQNTADVRPKAELEKFRRKVARESGGGNGGPNNHGSGNDHEPNIEPRSAILASAILPGLGQVLAGKRRRGIWIFLAMLAVLVTTYWWAFTAEVSSTWLFVIPFWIVQALDAGLVARREIPRTTRLALLGMLPVYLIGWQATEISAKTFVERFDRITPFIRGLTNPDFFDPEYDEVSAKVRFWAPCNPEQASTKAALTDEAPSISVDPACARLDETVEISGAGWEPEVEIEIEWEGPTGDRLPFNDLNLRSDAEGRFEISVDVPLKSVPESVRKRRPDDPQNQHVHAIYRTPTGDLVVSVPFADILKYMGETVAIGLMATLLGTLLAIPLSLLGARNLMRAGPGAIWIYRTARLFMNVMRSIESLILAVIFVVWVGQGPFAGMLALATHTMAAIGKLFSEAIESIDEGPVEAMRATGASWLQIVKFAVVPQVLPPCVAFVIYRWEINVRMSTILGFVGGGGIGFILSQWIQKSEWRQVSTAVISIAAVLIVFDQISSYTRTRIAEGRPLATGWRRPIAAAVVLWLIIWAGRASDMDPRRLMEDIEKIKPITQSLLQPDLLDPETISSTLRAEFIGPCGSDPEPSKAEEGSIGLTLSANCGDAESEIRVAGTGLSNVDSARLRWIVPGMPGRLGAGFQDIEGDRFEEPIEIRKLVIDQIVETGEPAYLVLETQTNTGKMLISEASRKTIDKLMETILMALMAASIGALFAFPLAFAGARNIVPHTAIGNLIYYGTRTFLNIARAIEPLVLAAIFASWVGRGSPFGGVLALIWITMANLGKLFSEAVEDINTGPLEAIQATGANRVQTVWNGVIPQIVPSFLAFGIYHWDIDVRLSTIVGFVGGGGLGFILLEYMKVTQWSQAAVCMLAIVIVVTTMDTISARVREALV